MSVGSTTRRNFGPDPTDSGGGAAPAPPPPPVTAVVSQNGNGTDDVYGAESDGSGLSYSYKNDSQIYNIKVTDVPGTTSDNREFDTASATIANADNPTRTSAPLSIDHGVINDGTAAQLGFRNVQEQSPAIAHQGYATLLANLAGEYQDEGVPAMYARPYTVAQTQALTDAGFKPSAEGGGWYEAQTADVATTTQQNLTTFGINQNTTDEQAAEGAVDVDGANSGDGGDLSTPRTNWDPKAPGSNNTLDAMARLSQAAYKDPATALAMAKNLGFDGVETVTAGSVQAIVAYGANKGVAAAFRGTANGSNILTDLSALRTGDDGAYVHSGFKAAADALTSAGVQQVIAKHLLSLPDDAPGKNVLNITGHSLGGAEATLEAFDLQKDGINVTGVDTYGSPKVGNKKFAEDYDSLLGSKTTPVVTQNDPVPRAPPPLGYTHVAIGNRKTLASDGSQGSNTSLSGFWVPAHFLSAYIPRLDAVSTIENPAAPGG